MENGVMKCRQSHSKVTAVRGMGVIRPDHRFKANLVFVLMGLKYIFKLMHGRLTAVPVVHHTRVSWLQGRQSFALMANKLGALAIRLLVDPVSLKEFQHLELRSK